MDWLGRHPGRPLSRGLLLFYTTEMGSGWSRAKRLEVEKAFYAFLNQCYVNSKDSGRICLGENLYDGQIIFISQTFDALERDVHKIFVLKSRQLGISTIARALTIFLLGIYDGFMGAVVFDVLTVATKMRLAQK